MTGKGRLYSERISKFGKKTRGVRDTGRDLNPACDEDVMNPGFVTEKGGRVKVSFQAVSKLMHFSHWWGVQRRDGSHGPASNDRDQNHCNNVANNKNYLDINKARAAVTFFPSDGG